MGFPYFKKRGIFNFDELKPGALHSVNGLDKVFKKIEGFCFIKFVGRIRPHRIIYRTAVSVIASFLAILTRSGRSAVTVHFSTLEIIEGITAGSFFSYLGGIFLPGGCRMFLDVVRHYLSLRLTQVGV